MRDKLMVAYLRRKMAFLEAMENFGKEERGASDIVAILLVIVILIAVAAIFRKQLTELTEKVFTKLGTELGV